MFTIAWKPKTSRTKFILCIFVIVLISIKLMSMNTDDFIRCPCRDMVNTEDRVMRNLPLLLKSKNNKSLASQLEEEHQSFPAEFLIHQELIGERCHSNPGLFTIKHHSEIWQEAQIYNTNFLLYSAHLDNRNTKEGPLIRILGVADSAWPPTPYCSIFTNNNEMKTVFKAISMEYIHWEYPRVDMWQPFIITCRGTNEKGDLAKVVSLTQGPCSNQPTNALRVLDSTATVKQQKLAVCTKFLYGGTDDFSIRLIEWIETIRELEVDTVTFYVHSVHPNVSKALKHYQKIGIAKLFSWKNPSPIPNIPSLQKIFFDTQRYELFTLENIPYTDCLLRHINSHEFVGVWDEDEIFIPQNGVSIIQVITAARAKLSMLEKRQATSYVARSSYFFNNLTDLSVVKEYTANSTYWADELRILIHTKRSFKFTPLLVYVKSIHDTSLALGLHAHYALSNIYGKIDRQNDLYNLYPISEAFIGHYRDECQGVDQTECNLDYRRNTAEDRTIVGHGESIFNNVNKILNKLKI